MLWGRMQRHVPVSGKGEVSPCTAPLILDRTQERFIPSTVYRGELFAHFLLILLAPSKMRVTMCSGNVSSRLVCQKGAYIERTNHGLKQKQWLCLDRQFPSIFCSLDQDRELLQTICLVEVTTRSQQSMLLCEDTKLDHC